MPYFTEASFSATARPGTTREQVAQALDPLIAYTGGDILDNPGSSAFYWFDGEEFGAQISGNYSHDFPEIFEQACQQAGELASEAFTSTLTNDDVGCEADRTTERLWGPADDRRRLQVELASSEALGCMRGAKLPAVHGVDADHLSEQSQVGVISHSGLDVGLQVMFLDVEALAALGLTAAQKDAVVKHFHQVAGLLQEWSRRKLVLVGRVQAPSQHVQLQSMDIAWLALPADGSWQPGHGPEVGEGDEFWFEDRDDLSRLFYVRVVRGEVTVASEHRDHHIRNVPERQRA